MEIGIEFILIDVLAACIFEDIYGGRGRWSILFEMSRAAPPCAVPSGWSALIISSPNMLREEALVKCVSEISAA